MLEGDTKAKDQGHRCKCTWKKKDLRFFFIQSPKKIKWSPNRIFYPISKNKDKKKQKKVTANFPQRFWRFSQNFVVSSDTAVLGQGQGNF